MTLIEQSPILSILLALIPYGMIGGFFWVESKISVNIDLIGTLVLTPSLFTGLLVSPALFIGGTFVLLGVAITDTVIKTVIVLGGITLLFLFVISLAAMP